MPYKDTWKKHIPSEKLKAYKQLINEGRIMKHHVIYDKKTKVTTVEYSAIAPHEWILSELKRRSQNERAGTDPAAEG